MAASRHITLQLLVVAVALVSAPVCAQASLAQSTGRHSRAGAPAAPRAAPFEFDVSHLKDTVARARARRSELPRRLRSHPAAGGLGTVGGARVLDVDVAVSNQFECNPLPLGGTVPPGVRSICYDISVPLFYNDTTRGNITVFVRRTFVGEPGQGDLLWMLPGGSGVASWAESSIAAPVVYGLHAQLNVSWDIMMMDKRGTGNSRCATGAHMLMPWLLLRACLRFCRVRWLMAASPQCSRTASSCPDPTPCNALPMYR